MKNSIIFFLIGLLTFIVLYSQDRIPLTDVAQLRIEGQTNYFYNGEKFTGILYENHLNKNLKLEFNVVNGFYIICLLA